MTDNSNNEILKMEREVLVEVINILMGSAAATLTTILDRKATMRCGEVLAVEASELDLSNLSPTAGGTFLFSKGVIGAGALLFHKNDLKNILRHLLSLPSEEDVEFDEIGTGAITEVLSQMLASAAEAFSSFSGAETTATAADMEDSLTKAKVIAAFEATPSIVYHAQLALMVEDLFESQCSIVLEHRLAKQILHLSLGSQDGNKLVEEESRASGSEVVLPVKEPGGKATLVSATPYVYKALNDETTSGDNTRKGNLELIMSVPVQITVELGRTRKKIKEIAEYMPGNIIELDRQAGDQVDIVANGRLIARGDVVVVDDNYSVRITEIVKTRHSINPLE